MIFAIFSRMIDIEPVLFLGDGLMFFLFLPLPGEMVQFD